MIWKPKQIGKTSLSDEILTEDKKRCRRFGPCGVGDKALYLNSFYFDRRYYVTLDSVQRAFKRVAMSQGGFSGKGTFATLPYLVVQFDNGEEKQCLFKHEEHVDMLLDYLQSKHPQIKVHSAEAEKKLIEKQKRLEEKKNRIVSEEASKQIQILEEGIAYLEKRPELYRELSIAAKKKRTFEQSNSAYKWAAIFIMLLGAGALVYGIYALATHAGMGIYFLLFGLAAIFLFSSANVLPTAKNNRRYIENRLDKANKEMERFLMQYKMFPVPSCYAHPGVLRRMEDILADGRTESMEEAFTLMKQDLQALNSSVTVEQEEYDEIMAIKPMFLVRDYK